MAETFKDVKTFIETAKVDEYGYYTFSANDKYPKTIIHIYNTKRECNVIRKHSSDPGDETIIGKLYFDNDEVSMIGVKYGVADYDNTVRCHVLSEITSDECYNKFHRAFKMFSSPMYYTVKVMALEGKIINEFKNLK